MQAANRMAAFILRALGQDTTEIHDHQTISKPPVTKRKRFHLVSWMQQNTLYRVFQRMRVCYRLAKYFRCSKAESRGLRLESNKRVGESTHERGRGPRASTRLFVTCLLITSLDINYSTFSKMDLKIYEALFLNTRSLWPGYHWLSFFFLFFFFSMPYSNKGILYLEDIYIYTRLKFLRLIVCLINSQVNLLHSMVSRLQRPHNGGLI